MPWTNHEKRTVGELPRISGKPVTIRKDADGKPVAIHCCPEDAKAPDGWGARSPHPTKKGWVKYWIWLPLLLFGCLLVAPFLCK